MVKSLPESVLPALMDVPLVKLPLPTHVLPAVPIYSTHLRQVRVWLLVNARQEHSGTFSPLLYLHNVQLHAHLV